MVLHSRAAALARSGALGSAAALLDAAVQAGPQRPAALDLLARIRAQMGEWAEAEKLWLQVAQLEPGHAGAAAALARLRQGRSGLRGAGPGLGAGLALLAATGLAAVLVMQRADWREQGREHRRALGALQAAQGERDERAQRQVQELQTRLTELAANQQSMLRRLDEEAVNRQRKLQELERAARAPAPLQLAFKVPGVLAARDGQDLLLGLQEAAFDADNRLTAGARARLRTLARAVVVTQERVVVEVAATATATAADGAPASEVAARQRAEQAAAALRATGLFPRHAILPLVRAAAAQDPGEGGLVLRLRRAAPAHAVQRPTS